MPSYTYYYAPKSGGRLESHDVTYPDGMVLMGWKDAESYANEDRLYFSTSTVKGFDFVLPVSGRPDSWATVAHNPQQMPVSHGYFLKSPYSDWAKQTFGPAATRVAVNHKDQVFILFRSETHLIMFKMRWQDDL